METSRGPTIEDLLRLAREDVTRNSLTNAEKTLEQAILMNNQVPDRVSSLGLRLFQAGKVQESHFGVSTRLAARSFSHRSRHRVEQPV